MNARRYLLAAAILGLTTGNPAGAQIAVIDGASLGQLQQQVTYWQDQVRAMAAQYRTLQAQLAAATGTRGIGKLLPLTPADRNYLPTSAPDMVAAATSARPQDAALHAAYAESLTRESALPNAALARLSAAESSNVNARRSAIAVRSSLMQAAIANASHRFAELQQLIIAIDRGQDAKSSLDLQDRIAAEQAMALTESTKLAATSGWTDATIAATHAQTRELAVAAHGTFGQRFHPTLK